MRLACFRISVSPSRSFILRYLGMGARGQLGARPASARPPTGLPSPPAAPSLLALPIQGRRQRLHLLHGWGLLPFVELALDLVLQLIAHLQRQGRPAGTQLQGAPAMLRTPSAAPSSGPPLRP